MVERAAALGSPILRVASGFYRADLAARPGAIEAERQWTIEALGAALPAARAAGIVLAIENHSDFTVAEYRSILAATGEEQEEARLAAAGFVPAATRVLLTAPGGS